PSIDWRIASGSFAIPDRAVAVTIFHLIKSVGSLAVDAYDLEKVNIASDPANLISNPSLETQTTNGLPADWAKGRWGTNTTTFTYPIAGYQSAKAAQVNISQYTTGDAKWYFKDVPVVPGTAYEFSDYYSSNVTTYITLRFTLNDGTFKYLDLNPAATAIQWQLYKNYF